MVTDFLLLWMTAFVRKRKVRLWRLLLGSFIGTTYILSLFIEAAAGLYTWYGKLGLSIAMVIAAFGYQRIALSFKDILLFYTVSFLFGGGVFALTFLLQGQESTLNGLLIFEDAYVYPQASFFTLVIGYIAMFALSKYVFRVIEIGKRRAQFLLPLRLSVMGVELSATGLLDSGNSLHDPMTRNPVVIVEHSLLMTILPPTLSAAVANGNDTALADVHWLYQLPKAWQSRIRFLPFRGVSAGSHMLIAVALDWLEIMDGDRRFRSEHVIAGLTVGPLSAENTYSVILHPHLVQEGAGTVQFLEEVSYAEGTTS